MARYTGRMTCPARPICPIRLSCAILLCLALSGCYVKLHTLETSGPAGTTTTTSSQVAGLAKFSSGAAAFSSGPAISSSAPGGYASLGKGGSAVLIVGLMLADLVNYIAGPSGPKPLPPDERIMETCSCFQKPAMGNGQ